MDWAKITIDCKNDVCLVHVCYCKEPLDSVKERSRGFKSFREAVKYLETLADKPKKGE